MEFTSYKVLGLRRGDLATDIGIYETGFRNIYFKPYYSKNSVLRQVFSLGRTYFSNQRIQIHKLNLDAVVIACERTIYIARYDEILAVRILFTECE